MQVFFNSKVRGLPGEKAHPLPDGGQVCPLACQSSQAARSCGSSHCPGPGLGPHLAALVLISTARSSFAVDIVAKLCSPHAREAPSGPDKALSPQSCQSPRRLNCSARLFADGTATCSAAQTAKSNPARFCAGLQQRKIESVINSLVKVSSLSAQHAQALQSQTAPPCPLQHDRRSFCPLPVHCR